MEDGRLRLVVGLGNPGKEYEKTRHNVGFEVIDTLSEQLDIKVRRKKFGGLVGEGVCGNDKLILLKPLSYMNRSGQVLATVVGFYKIELENLLVVSDDMALETGRIRLRPQGSSGGQKGLADIIQKLGSQDFCRLRIGIGAPIGDPVGYVLGRPGTHDRKLIETAIAGAADAVKCWLDFGIDKTMNEFNQSNNLDGCESGNDKS